MGKQTPEREELLQDGAHLNERGVDSTLDSQTSGADVHYADLGRHVGAVLKAAEQAALAIRKEAEDESARRIDEAGREAGQILHDAEGLRAEAEEANKAIREQAKAYAEKRRRDADVEATEVLRAAQETVVRRSSEDEARQRALQEDVERTEKRLTELAAGLHDLAARLEALAAVKSPEDGPPAGTEQTSLDQSLLASLGQEGVGERPT